MPPGVGSVFGDYLCGVGNTLGGRTFAVQLILRPSLAPRHRQQIPYCCQKRNHGLCASILSCLRFAAAMSLALSGLVSGFPKICSSRSISAAVCSASIPSISNMGGAIVKRSGTESHACENVLSPTGRQRRLVTAAANCILADAKLRRCWRDRYLDISSGGLIWIIVACTTHLRHSAAAGQNEKAKN
jgi:hypothetical protein